MRWRTLLSAWQAPSHFVDEQERGPYALWHHTHSFRSLGGGTLISDRVRYRLPFGPLGRVAHRLWVRASLGAIFDFRFARIGQRFGVVEDRGDEKVA